MEMIMEGLYLMIVRRDKNGWIVGEDSYHILEDEGGGSDVLELRVQAVRSLAPSPEKERHVETDNQDTHRKEATATA